MLFAKVLFSRSWHGSRVHPYSNSKVRIYRTCGNHILSRMCLFYCKPSCIVKSGTEKRTATATTMSRWFTVLVFFGTDEPITTHTCMTLENLNHFSSLEIPDICFMVLASCHNPFAACHAEAGGYTVF